ncbi:MAG: hypothetical protein ACE5LS_05920 [Thermoplasmata archaeon]
MYEPGLMAVGLLLVGAGTLLGWWGLETDTSNIPYRASQGVEFGPWLATEWTFIILPGAILRRAVTMPWWEFVGAHPEFAGYSTIAILLSSLYLAAAGLTLYALVRRRAPGPRRNGWPTLAQAVALIAVIAAFVIATLGLPAVAEASSFLGSSGRVQWGPRAGWFVALVAPLFLGASTVYGWRTDRRLKGLCWKCHRPVPADPCEYCGMAQ